MDAFGFSVRYFFVTLLQVVLISQIKCADIGGNMASLDPSMQNVCAFRDVMIAPVQKPCTRAFSRMVKVWKPNCGYNHNWCVGYERRFVCLLLDA